MKLSNKKPRNKSKSSQSNTNEKKNYIQFTKYGITTVKNLYKIIIYSKISLLNYFISFK